MTHQIPEDEVVEATVTGVSGLTPRTEGLLEAAKDLLVQSVTVGRDFCKSMIEFSTGAIAVYTALLTFGWPEKYTLDQNEKLAAVAPALVFLAATILAAIGYFPRLGKMNLNSVSGIEEARSKIVGQRALWGGLAFLTFCIGLAFSAWAIIFLRPPV